MFQKFCRTPELTFFAFPLTIQLYSKEKDVHKMKTTALSVRMSTAESHQVDLCAKRGGMDRSALLKQLIRTGLKQYKLDQAVQDYRAQRASLSRAAEIAGLSVRDFISRMGSVGLELNYGVEEFESDLLGSPS